MTAFLLSDLETRIRQRATMTGSTVVGSTEVDTYANLGLAEYYDLLIDLYGHEHFEASKAFTVKTTAGVDIAWDVGAGAAVNTGLWIQLLSVHITNPDGSKSSVLPFEHGERDRVGVGGYSPRRPKIRYRWTGAALEFEPTPSGNNLTGIAYYVPAFTPLVRGVTPTSFVINNGWEEFPIVCAAIKMRDKQGTDSSKLEVDRDRLRVRIMATAGKRNRGGASTLQRRARW